MRKLIGILSVALLPIISFAHDYISGGLGHGEFESSRSVWGGLLVLIFTPVILIILGICLFVFWLMMLIDAIKHSPEKTKIVWVLVIIFTHIVGAFVYYFVEYRLTHKPKTEHRSVEDKISENDR